MAKGKLKLIVFVAVVATIVYAGTHVVCHLTRKDLLTSCQMHVGLATNDRQWILVLKNNTTNTVWVHTDILLETGFEWELFRNKTLVTNRHRGQYPSYPMSMPIHIDHGPLDLSPGQIYTMKVNDVFPELGDVSVVRKNDLLVWYCRFFDEYSSKWVQSCGQVTNNIMDN
jgi:hypothetical protein